MQRLLLLFLIALSYTLFGGSPRWTLAPLLATAAVTLLVAPRSSFSFPQPHRVLDLALAALAAGIVLQLVPLPSMVVALLSPNVDHLAGALHLTQLGAVPTTWTRLSVNPSATGDSLGTLALGLMAFWSARGLLSSGGSARHFCRALAIIGGAAAVSAVIFRAAAPGLVNGMLRPDVRSANPFGAFINRNHLGGWLMMLVGPVCGYLIAHVRMHPAYRLRFWLKFRQFMASGASLTAMCTFAMIGVLLLTLSRSAVAGLGAAALCGWALGRQRLSIERTSLPMILALTGVVLMAVVLFVDVGGWATRLGQSFDTTSAGWSRLTIWRESLPIVADFWAVGTGAGTFGDSMTVYQQSRIWVGSMNQWAHFNNAHSHYIQVAVEGGLLLSVPAIVAAIAFWRVGQRAIRTDKGEMFWVRLGALSSLVGIAVQSLWEVSLVMPANAVLAGVLGGLVVYQRDHNTKTDKDMMAGAA